MIVFLFLITDPEEVALASFELLETRIALEEASEELQSCERKRQHQMRAISRLKSKLKVKNFMLKSK